MTTPFFKAQVIENIKLNYKFISIKFIINDPSFSFKAGQFILIKIVNVFRSYSLASLPGELPYFNLFVDVTPQGVGTKFLQSLKIGESIEISKPVGAFTLKDKTFKNYIMCATGCGFAPVKPLIEELLKDKNCSIYLYWGLRFEKDAVFKDILESWKIEHDNFNYDLIFSQSKQKKHVNYFAVQKILSLPRNKTGVYLSGNAIFIKEMREDLKKTNFLQDRICFENT